MKEAGNGNSELPRARFHGTQEGIADRYIYAGLGTTFSVADSPAAFGAH